MMMKQFEPLYCKTRIGILTFLSALTIRMGERLPIVCDLCYVLNGYLYKSQESVR